MKIRLPLVLIFSFSILTACSNRVLLKPDTPEMHTKTEAVINKLFFKTGPKNELDRMIISKSLPPLFAYLSTRYGPESFNRFYTVFLKEAGNKNPAFWKAFREVYQKNFYNIVSEMTSQTTFDYSIENREIITNVGPFIYHFLSGSGADIDSAELLQLSSRYFQEIQNSAYNEKVFPANRNYPVYFIPSERLTSKESIFGETFMGYGIQSNESRYLTSAMILRYDTALSTIALAHELTHMSLIFPQIPEEFYQLPETNFKVSEKIFPSRILSFGAGTLLGEGVAQLVSENINIFNIYGFISDPDEELSYRKNSGMEIRTFRDLFAKDFNNTPTEQKILLYIESESLTRYIVKNYGYEKFTRLLKSNQSYVDFAEILGIAFETLGENWMKSF